MLLNVIFAQVWSGNGGNAPSGGVIEDAGEEDRDG